MDLSKYGFSVWSLLSIKAFSNSNNKDSSRTTSEQDQEGLGWQSGDETEIAEVPMTSRVDDIFVENGGIVGVRVSNMSDCH